METKRKPKSIVSIFFGFSAVILFLEFSFNLSKPQYEKDNENELQQLFFFNPKDSVGANPYNPLTTNNRLSIYYPYNTTNTGSKLNRKIPKIIVQSSDDATIEGSKYELLSKKWIEMNPTYKYIYQSQDQLIESMIDTFRDTVPEVTATLQLLPDKRLRGQFAKYLFLYLNGGTLVDTDVFPRKPIDEWYGSNEDIGFVTTVDSDTINVWKYAETPDDLVRLKLGTFFMRSKPHHPILRRMICTIIYTTFEARKIGKLNTFFAYSDSVMDVDHCAITSVASWVGNVMVTNVLFSYFNSLVNPTVTDFHIGKRLISVHSSEGPRLNHGEGFNWLTFTSIKEPILVDDILVLPFVSFRKKAKACEQYCYGTYLNGGSWKISSLRGQY
ncbi:unnamed protein product [Ambrosiozyma monospora]|uniref:Unnamed protein product n=1 Tax=Ambrosiozyma monospora TaxID=43982 RepID=A0A9W6Z1P4_AMBMO|nr:unnamed protein product [Ambrosiozyma monospora]